MSHLFQLIHFYWFCNNLSVVDVQEKEFYLTPMEIEKNSSQDLEQKYSKIDGDSSLQRRRTWAAAGMVRLAKAVLMDILPRQKLRKETLRAYLADVKNILNTRRLTYKPLDIV